MHHYLNCSSLSLPPLPPLPLPSLSPSGGGFPGLYTALLPARCWDDEGRRVLLHSWWGSTQTVVCVEVEGGGMHRVMGEKGTWTVLDVAHGLVVAQFASPSTPPKLVSGRLPRCSSQCVQPSLCLSSLLGPSLLLLAAPSPGQSLVSWRNCTLKSLVAVGILPTPSLLSCHAQSSDGGS